jgi:hypothetical protein
VVDPVYQQRGFTKAAFFLVRPAGRLGAILMLRIIHFL